MLNFIFMACGLIMQLGKFSGFVRICNKVCL